VRRARPGGGTHVRAKCEGVGAPRKPRGKLPRRPALPLDEPLPTPTPEEQPALRKKVEVAEQPPRPVMSRPAVVIPLFLLCVGALVAGFYLSRTDPDDLYARAQPLMHSDDPADW